MAVTAYKLISASASDASRLNADVAAAIADGYQPLGGVAFVAGAVVQAMVQGTPEVGEGSYTLPAAAAEDLGGVLEADVVADAVDSEDIVAQFNALLASLRASGALASA